ncbi:MAG TPA: penicillin-binding protein activator LpoB [Acidiferrobacterales bacterium]|nr:penicillin-binding protein activator LpoB [Acidiferrobacterales bacterium]
MISQANMRSFRISSLALLLAGLLSACATSVDRMQVDEVKDLSGAWNDTDSRLVSEEMIQDVLSRAWIQDYTGAHKKQPSVIVGEVRNLSHEHINLNTFVADMERALINSGKVQFVASRVEREDVREERKDQDVHASETTRKPMGQEIGADYMLKGAINTIIDLDGSTQVRYYQVDLNLISLSDNRVVWLGQKKIKKLVKRSRLRS